MRDDASRTYGVGVNRAVAVAAVAGLAMLGLACESAPTTAAGGTPPSFIVLNPTADPSTSQTVTWRSSAYADQRIIVRPAAGGNGITFKATRKPATSVDTTGSARPAYTATATGLKPGTSYTYVVKNAHAISATLPFTTATSGYTGPWSFIGLGDTQVKNADVPAKIVSRAFHTVPRARIVLQAGDSVNRPYIHQEWVDLFRAMGRSGSTRDWLISIGNHEQCILVKSCRSDDALAFRTYFTWPGGQVDGQRPTWFATDYQGVRFVVIDSFGPDLAEQAEFLDQQLSDNPYKWSVVLMHAGPFASRGDRTNSKVFSLVQPVLERHDVDLVLAGHDHSYARGFHGGHHTTVYATSDSGPKYYSSSKTDWVRRGATRVRWGTDVSTFQIIDVRRDTLTYRAIVAAKGAHPTTSRPLGATLDKVVISKDAEGTKTVTW